MKKRNAREIIGEMFGMFAESLDNGGDAWERWVRRRHDVLDDEDQFALGRMKEKREFQKRITYLKKKGFLETKRVEKKLLVELTDIGMYEWMRRLVRERPMLSDGQICLVMYDIPIDGNLGRDALRYYLKRMGFKQLQKSVWQTDKHVVDEVKQLIEMVGMADWVRVYIAKKQ